MKIELKLTTLIISALILVGVSFLALNYFIPNKMKAKIVETEIIKIPIIKTIILTDTVNIVKYVNLDKDTVYLKPDTLGLWDDYLEKFLVYYNIDDSTQVGFFTVNYDTTLIDTNSSLIAEVSYNSKYPIPPGYFDSRFLLSTHKEMQKIYIEREETFFDKFNFSVGPGVSYLPNSEGNKFDLSISIIFGYKLF